jgi:TolA-binding protein
VTDDLVKRLRIIGAWKTPGGPLPSEEMIKPHLTCEEAAARIEELQKQLAASDKQIKDLEDEIENLEYEMCEMENRS